MVAAALVLPRPWFLVAVGFLSTLLVRVAVFGAVNIFVLVGGITAWIRARRPSAAVQGLRTVMLTLVCGGVAALVAVAWSPAPLDAVVIGLRWMALAPLLLLTINMLQAEGYRSATKVLAAMAPIAVVQAATTAIFRVNPSVEDGYYRSSVARFLLGEAAGGLFTVEGYNNVRELDRAGGFLFLSVNRAALVMGVMMLLYLACALFARRWWPFFVALLLAIAIVLGGSKTGLALLVMLPLFALALASVSSKRDPGARIGLLLLGLVAAVVGLQIVLNTADDFVEASQATLLPRYVLWGEAIGAILEQPLAGLGFGGWESRWESGMVAADFSYRPAHNWLLQAWLDGGILYAAMHLVLVGVVIVSMMRAVTRAQTLRQKRVAAFSGGAFLWAFIHGLFDNTAIFGDAQATVFLALAGSILLVGETIYIPPKQKSIASSRKQVPPPRRGRRGATD